MTSQHESSIDRRLFLGAVGALTRLGQPALAQDEKSDAKPDAKADAVAKRLSDTIADFVVGFDPKSLPPLAIERARLAVTRDRNARRRPHSAAHALLR